MNFALQNLSLVAIYVILGAALNMALGYVGLLSLCHGMLAAVGAYGSVLLVVRGSAPFPIALLFGAGLAAAIGAVVGVQGTRLKGDAFAVATLAVQMILFTMCNNWVGLTGGPFGIPSIPAPIVFGWQFSTPGEMALLTTALAGMVLIVQSRVVRAPFGRSLRSVRDDEIAALTLGKQPAILKVSAMFLSGAFAGIGGCLYAFHVRFIDPASFGFEESIFLLSIVILGGAGSIWSPIWGALIMVLLPEALRLLPVPHSVAANCRQIVFGLTLLVMMRLRPRGLAGEYEYD